ncbi:hypothetical protein GQ607_002877, partial [Colletotrichum asianum]
ITIDISINFYSYRFKYTTYTLVIIIKEVFIKAYYNINKVKYYYTTLRYTYNIIYTKDPSIPYK